MHRCSNVAAQPANQNFGGWMSEGVRRRLQLTGRMSSTSRRVFASRNEKPATFLVSYSPLALGARRLLYGHLGA